MARISFKNQSEYYLKLQLMGQHFYKDEPIERAVRAGANVVADEVRKSIEALPSEKFRRLNGQDRFGQVPEGQKRDLIESFGVAPISHDSHGFVNAKVGFDGYGKWKTKTYPEGVPNALIARAIESGSSVREKTPFVRPAVFRARKAAIEAMEKSIDEEFENIFRKGQVWQE